MRIQNAIYIEKVFTTISTYVGIIALSLWFTGCAATFPEPKSGEPYGIVAAIDPIYINQIDDISVRGLQEARVAPGHHAIKVMYSQKTYGGVARSTEDLTSTLNVESGIRYLLKAETDSSLGRLSPTKWAVTIIEEAIEDYGTPQEVSLRKEQLDYKRAKNADSTYHSLNQIKVGSLVIPVMSQEC